MATYQACTKNTSNSFEHCVGHNLTRFGEVNIHGLHAIRSHPFIIILHNTCMQKITI